MPKHMGRGIISGILAGLVLGAALILLGYLFDPLFVAEGMSLTGTNYMVASMFAGILYGVIFGGAFRIVYHSLPHPNQGIYYGLFIWAISGVVAITDAIIFTRASIVGSVLYLVMTLIAYILFSIVLEYLYEKYKY